jgi:hypothetical protein
LKNFRPAPLPAPTPPGSTPNEPKDKQQNDCAYQRAHDQFDDSTAKVNAQLRQQPIADERANETHHQIANEAKPTSAHDPAGEVPGDYTDDDDNKQALIRQVHAIPPRTVRTTSVPQSGRSAEDA